MNPWEIFIHNATLKPKPPKAYDSERECKRCLTTKDINEFAEKKEKGYTYRMGVCKDCVKEDRRISRLLKIVSFKPKG